MRYSLFERGFKDSSSAVMAAATGANSFVNPNWGNVIPVESVQELVKNHVDPHETVPRRYIRSQEERPTTSSLPVSLQTAIPVIDMNKLSILQPEDDQRLQEMTRLSSACQEWGFFQVCDLHTKVITINQ